jgi:hypothetical protein
MRHMPNFIPVRLPYSPSDPDYLKMIKAFRQWAGPNVYLGEIGVSAVDMKGELELRSLVMDKILNLNLAVTEMYGSTLSYTASAPTHAKPSPAGFVEVIRVHMRIDPESKIWITGLSAVKEGHWAKPKWSAQLPPRARELAIVSFLENHGVDPGVDVSALVEAIEAEGRRLAALSVP